MPSHDVTNALQSFLARKTAFENRFFMRWDKNVNQKTLVIVSVAGALALFLYAAVMRPPAEFPLDRLVTVEDGATLGEVALRFEEERVVRSPLAFKMLVVLYGSARGARAGDYLFKEPKNVLSVARIVSRGMYGLEPLRIRIPEGATVRDMARIYDTYLLRFDPDTFIAAALSEEGYLFPDTYYFLPNTSETQVARAMRENFDAKAATIAPDIERFGKPLSDIVTLASLLEREANNTEDRRMIAGVLWNRIRRDMALQVDAAFLYTLGKSTFDLTTADLQSDSPYNTYRYKGLPPTPIGSPSLDSLKAAITPARHSYLFYLADRNRVTHYSRTYEEHLRKKALYLGD